MVKSNILSTFVPIKIKTMDIKKHIDPSEYEIGVIIARFQVHKLHDAHVELINRVCEHHKKVIIFLGVSVVSNTKTNPLDFATRKAMIQEMYPNVVILPQKDQRSNERWSQVLDAEIRVPFGERSALLYGGRDSFIPYYSGKYPVAELTTDVYYSGTEVRKEVSREILNSADFRAGVIHSTFAQRPITYPTVDVVADNEKGQILLCKKPNEKNYRFIGGFVDRDDMNWENAARREFKEETGGCEIESLKYVASGQIKDWRYTKTEHGIMTTLYLGRFVYGRIEPSDDIASLHWVYPKDITIMDIMPEHQELYRSLITYMALKRTLTPLEKMVKEQD